MAANADILPSNHAEELIDFTCASPWERLALDIELELRSWGLHDGQIPSSQILSTTPTPNVHASPSSVIDPQPVTSSRISLGDRNLSLELRISPQNDTLDACPLERLLGISQSVMLTAAAPDGIAADDGSDAAVLLSALSVAASACACPLPVIVPVGRPSSLRFIGRQAFPSHLRFSCDYTHQPSENCGHLAGLLSLFRNKRTSARRLSPPSTKDARISAKFTYDWNDFSFKLALPPGTFASDRRLSALHLSALSQSDPVTRIRVTAIWNEFPAADLQRNEVLAGMPASTSSQLRLSTTQDLQKIITTSSIPSTRIPMMASARANIRLARSAASRSDSSHPAAPLALIDVQKAVRNSNRNRGRDRTPRASHIHLANRAASPRIGRSPSPTALDEYLAQVGEYVAMAAIQDDGIDEEFLTSAVAALFEMDLGRGIMVDVVEALGPNAAEMTLLERVARLVAVSESTNAAQKLWNLFLDGVEVHWEHQWIICGIPFSAESGPNHDENLLTQKLQMINCCTERRHREANGMLAQQGGSINSMGRKQLLQGVKLVGESESADTENDGVWEPFVQPHPLMTRDMVEEELKRMVLRAESSDRDEDLEAKRQSRTLRSDMMAFKAANPNAGMADFVRWFSPTDWISDTGSTRRDSDDFCADMNKEGELDVADAGLETEEGKSRLREGRLSARMSRTGNIWEQLWEEAEAVAANSQVPLFDAAAHGSKALADLRAMTLTQVLCHLSVIQGVSATQLLHHAFSKPPGLPSVKLTIERARHAMRDVCGSLELNSEDDSSEMGRVSVALEMVAVAEHSCLIAASVLRKLPPADGMGPIVDQLACGQCAVVENESQRRLVGRMAGLDDGGWRSVILPEWREFVVRGSSTGDRMYARISREEFRVGFRLELDYGV